MLLNISCSRSANLWTTLQGTLERAGFSHLASPTDQEPNGAGVCSQSEKQSSNIFSRQPCRRSISGD
ncbi:hypothetical protein AGR5A_Cc100021 [Agrobacterium genomosp. 5 str. CFBP 6626]|nr:hypothetical protein AGR5A_Cc100021 [Agrobacterium genomosp. 5 str. CFBP 6626]